MRAWIALLALLIVPSVAAFDSGNMDPQETFTMTFDTENPNGFSYHCHPHPWMTGMVHVNADTDGVVTEHFVSIIEPENVDDWGYDIEHLVIEVGDTVTWTNEGSTIHTVTQMDGDGSHDHDHGHDHTADVGEQAPGLGAMLLIAIVGVALARR